MALWLGAGPSVVRARAGRPPRAHRPHQGLLLGRTDVADPLAVAASLDVLAVCLAAGMAVSTAAAATAAVAPPRLARVLRRAADLLALGADPNIAWSRPPDLPPGTHDAQTDAVLRLARRSAASGAALADGIVELAVQVRHDAAQAAAAAAERAGVLIAGPLGLCFLPAFLCVGIVPLVVGRGQCTRRACRGRAGRTHGRTDSCHLGGGRRYDPRLSDQIRHRLTPLAPGVGQPGQPGVLVSPERSRCPGGRLRESDSRESVSPHPSSTPRIRLTVAWLIPASRR